MMRGSSLLPKQFRGPSDGSKSPPGWLNRKVTALLLAVIERACLHPIHTIVFIAILASTSYVGLLEGSLFEVTNGSKHERGHVDTASMLEGARTLRLGKETAWKWEEDEFVSISGKEGDFQHLALSTFVFPDSHTSTSQRAPPADAIGFPDNLTVTEVPTTLNMLSSISQDSTLAFTVPFDQISDFLMAVQEIPDTCKASNGHEGKMWLMKAARHNGNGLRGSIRAIFQDSWTSFVDLIKHAETLDIVIVALGYLSMHLTFISLFVSMRRLGSNFWLAFSLLLGGIFSSLFGLLVTTKLGVPVNMMLISEGLPFLVVTVGFEKAIIFTRAVLSASTNSHHTTPANGSSKGALNGKPSALAISTEPPSIERAIEAAVKEKGFEIVRDYAIEIAVLAAGAASGVQGGLRQFCFLAAWILFFDGIMLFVFYTTILCLKLEINRIKRHVELRKALEETGIDKRVAENVALSNDRAGIAGKHTDPTSVFGRTARASSVPRFKIWMVTGFVALNIINICTIPFRGGKSVGSPAVNSLQNVLSATPFDPFRVAENALDSIYVAAKSQKIETLVTILPPIKYELEYPSIHYATQDDDASNLELDYNDRFLDSVGGRAIKSILKSLEDPVLSKWIIIALAMSVILNGYLFNAARWSMKEPQPQTPVIPPPARVIPEPAQPDLTEDADAEVKEPSMARSREECERMLKEKRAAELTDEELIDLSSRGKLPGHALEKSLEDPEHMSRLASFTRAVKIRRAIISRTPATRKITASLESSKAPYRGYNYELVHGACCENVIGYLPLPIGVAGPLVIDGESYFIPMATTEGVLVASTSRGCKAINAGGGAVTVVTGDGMTRGPCIAFPNLTRAGAAKIWLDSEDGQRTMKNAFNSTSRFARLQTMKTALAGTNLYIRFKTTTGDAMGMNMISKGVEKALDVMKQESGFDDMAIISVSGNYCIDKKPAAINWIDGRGKSVVAEALIPADVVKSVLKSEVNALVELNTSKNYIGSAMAGSIGGFNAHAANIVAAMFLATGQDPAQVVESANCITIMKNVNGNLQISVSMPSIEVGTLGGGTILEAQSAMLEILGVRGSHPTNPGDNARRLARIIGAAVLAGELSLCSALAAGHLVRAHMAHNRSAAPTRTATPVSAAVAPFQRIVESPRSSDKDKRLQPEGLTITPGR